MARRGSKTRTRSASADFEGSTDQTNLKATSPEETAVFPEVPPDSGRPHAIEAAKEILAPDREAAKAAAEDPSLRIARHVKGYLGHPNRTMVEDEETTGNRPFGSQAQNLDPETGNLIPMGPEERRTGFAEDDEDTDQSAPAARKAKE